MRQARNWWSQMVYAACAGGMRQRQGSQGHWDTVTAESRLSTTPPTPPVLPRALWCPGSHWEAPWGKAPLSFWPTWLTMSIGHLGAHGYWGCRLCSQQKEVPRPDTSRLSDWRQLQFSNPVATPSFTGNREIPGALPTWQWDSLLFIVLCGPSHGFPKMTKSQLCGGRFFTNQKWKATGERDVCERPRCLN